MNWKSRIRFIAAIMIIIMLVSGISAQDTDEITTRFVELQETSPTFEYSEEVVTFESEGFNVVGTLARPEQEAPSPIVLLLHGFISVRDELPIVNTDEGMYSRTARLFAERGYASLRIDFRGLGDSGGAWEDTSFTGQIADALAALDFIQTLDGIDADRIGVIGLSQGGLIAASIASDPRLDSVVLWSPVANPPDTYASILGEQGIQAGLSSGGAAVNLKLPWGAETQLRTAFFEDLYSIDPVAEIAQYDGPLMVIVGTTDDVVAPQPYYGQLYINYHPGIHRLIVLEDTGHVFNIVDGPERLDEVIFWSLAWLKHTMD